MEVTIRGRHFDVPELVQERARRKLGRLDHFLPLLRDAVVEVDVGHERSKEPDGRFVVHVMVSAAGVRLHAEERAASLETAVDQAAQALTSQARKHKQRLYERGRPRVAKDAATTAGATPASPSAADDEESGLLRRVGRVKRFSVKPMTTEEALEQIELLGHDFFIFHDAELGQFALLYRRSAGDYGLIIPELS
jgi:ribosomal subunit interface protein